MTETTSKYADFEGLHAQAVALRRESLPFTNSDPDVIKSAELCRRVEGAWYGIVLGADPADRRNVWFSRD